MPGIHWVKALGAMMVTAVSLLSYTGSQAVECNFPVRVPTFEVGETWVFQNAKPQQRTVTVVGFEGGLVAMKYARPTDPATAEIRYFDAQHILRKVQKKDGTIVDKPAPAYQAIGVATWEFPLVLGKTWEYTTAAYGAREPTTFIHSYKVARCEEVSTRAGTFSAVRIEYRQMNVKFNSWGDRTFWFAPSAKYQIRVKNGAEWRPGFWPATTLDEDLIDFRLAPAPAAIAEVAPTGAELRSPLSTSAPAPSPAPVGREGSVDSPVLRPPNSPWLGVPLGPAEEQLGKRLGLRPGQGAAVLPFKRNPNLPIVDLDPGDLILGLDGVDVEGPGHLAALLAGKPAGSTVKVRTYRGQYQRQVDQPMVILQGEP